MGQLSLSLLGGFQARLDEGPLLALPAKAQALLAYLAARPGQAHPRDKLAALLWGATGQYQARSNLRHTLFTIRQAIRGLSPGLLVAEAQGVALEPAAADVDVLSFEKLVAEGTEEAFERAAALYRGELLEGLSVDEPPFEEWLLAERERLRELALEALARLLAHQAKSQATERAIQTALRLLALDPLQEPAHRTLMRLYARQGRRSAALRQYQVCFGVLRRELGAEPEPETRRLYQDILQQRVSQSADPEAHLTSTMPHTHPAGHVGERPLIGRAGELAQLGRALDEVRSGLGRVFMIVGEAIGLTSERDLVLLPERILTAARRFTHAEAGTLYLRDGDRLRFVIVQNDVLARRLGEREMERLFEFHLPLSKPSLPGYVALSGDVLSVSDAYEIPTGRPYSFNRAVDAQTGYRTRSVLAVPLKEPAGNVVGVFQLINARDASNQIVPFDPDYEELIRALASQATVAVRNAQLEEVARGRAAHRVVASLATAMAHEINNPLMVIKGNVQLLVKTTSDPVSRQRIDAVLGAVDAIHEIVNACTESPSSNSPTSLAPRNGGAGMSPRPFRRTPW